MASCRDCSCDSAPCRDSRQEAKSHTQSLQEAIYQAQQSWQEARDHGQSRRKPNITDSLCRKRKLADLFIPTSGEEDGDDAEDEKHEKLDQENHTDHDTALEEQTNTIDDVVTEDQPISPVLGKDEKQLPDCEKENKTKKLDTVLDTSKEALEKDSCNEKNSDLNLKMSIGELISKDSKQEAMKEDKKESEKIDDKYALCNGKENCFDKSSVLQDKVVPLKTENECKDSYKTVNGSKDSNKKVNTERNDFNWMLALNNADRKSENVKERPETPPLQKLMRQDFSPLKSESAFTPSPKKVKEGFTSKLASVIVPPSPVIPRAASHPKQLLSHNISNLRTSLKSITNPRTFRSSHSNRPSPYPSIKSFVQGDEQPLDLSTKSKVQENNHLRKSRAGSDTRYKASSHIPKQGNGISSPVSTSLQSLQQKFGGDFHLPGLQKPSNYMLYGPDIPALHRALLHSATLSLPHMALSMSNDFPKHSRFEHSPVQKHRNSTPSPPKSKHEESSKSIKTERCATPEKSSRLEKADLDRLENTSPVSDDLESKADKYTNHMCTCGKWFDNLYALSLHLQETGHLPARSKAVSLLEYPKLVRGQDMWLNQESEQTRRILRCIQCGESFKTLPMLTVHMMKTQHYTKIVSSEHARRAHKCSAYCDREPDKECVFKCKVCQETFTDMEGLANHMIMSGHHKKQVVRTNPGMPDVGLRTKRKRYYGFEDINPYNPTVAALLDYKRKCMMDRGSPDYSLDNDSDESESTITCENCGRRIGTKLFVEHVRACVGMKLSEEDFFKKEKIEPKSEKEKTPGLSSKLALLEKLYKMDVDFDAEEGMAKSHPRDTTTTSKEYNERDKDYGASNIEPKSPKESIGPNYNSDFKSCEKNQLIKKLFEEDLFDKSVDKNSGKENLGKSTKCSSPVKEIQKCESKKLSSPSLSPSKLCDSPVKLEPKEQTDKISVPHSKLTSADSKSIHASKKLDIIDPDHMKEESSGKSALSAMESFIQKSFSNKFDYKKGNIVLSPTSSSDIASIHSRSLESAMIPENSLDYINKYRKFYTALTSQNGFNDSIYSSLKDTGLNGDVEKLSDEKKSTSKDRVLSPSVNNVTDKDEVSSVKSNHSESSVDRTETLEKKYLDVPDTEDTKSDNAKSSALDNLSSFVYGQPMTSEHPLDSLQRLITKTDIPKLMASAGAKTFKYLPPHLQLQATGELPVPLNLSLKGPDDSDDDEQMRLDDETLSDCDGALSPTNSDGEPMEYRCAACSRRFASKGSYRYHLSRCHLSSVKRYGIKEAFNMSPYVYLPLDHTARFSKYYEMAKELANKRKQQ